MRNRKNIATAIVLGIIFVGGLAYLSFNKPASTASLGGGHQPPGTLPPVRGYADSDAAVGGGTGSGPYITKGQNARDDNFFIPGRVESLASLADATKQATIVWVSAGWCEICHAMRPFVWKSANKYANSVALKEIDYDTNPGIVRDNAIYGTPAFFVLDQSGVVVSRFGGATQESFEQQLERASQS